MKTFKKTFVAIATVATLAATALHLDPSLRVGWGTRRRLVWPRRGSRLRLQLVWLQLVWLQPILVQPLLSWWSPPLMRRARNRPPERFLIRRFFAIRLVQPQRQFAAAEPFSAGSVPATRLVRMQRNAGALDAKPRGAVPSRDRSCLAANPYSGRISDQAAAADVRFESSAAASVFVVSPGFQSINRVQSAVEPGPHKSSVATRTPGRPKPVA
jgi:hypothetical protein